MFFNSEIFFSGSFWDSVRGAPSQCHCDGRPTALLHLYTSEQRFVGNSSASVCLFGKSEQCWLCQKQNVFCFLSLVVARIDNSRMKSLEFEVKTSCTLHGFAGYFEAILYKDIMLSKLHHVNLSYLIRRWSGVAVLLLLRPARNVLLSTRGSANEIKSADFLANQEQFD